GLPPYYLTVPELHSILFVTATGSYEHKVVYHLCNTNSFQTVDIKDNGSTFGGNIGGTNTTDGHFRDYVQRAEPHLLVLAADYPNLTKRYYISLGSRTVERVVQDHFDNGGNLLRRDVLPQSKSTNP